MDTWNQSAKNWTDIGQALLAPSLKLAEDLGAQNMTLLRATSSAPQAWMKRLQEHGVAALSASSPQDHAGLLKQLFEDFVADAKSRGDEVGQAIKTLAADLEDAPSDALDQYLDTLNRATAQLNADANAVFVRYLDQVEKGLDLLIEAGEARAAH